MPAPALPAATVAVTSDSFGDPSAHLAMIEAAPTKIRTYLRGAQEGPMRMSCVQQRLAEAQVHVMLARDEMKTLAATYPVSAGDRAHARQRMMLLAQRTQEVERAAYLCIEDEQSTITATKFEVEVPTAVQKRGDVTSAPEPPHPCLGVDCTVLPTP